MLITYVLFRDIFIEMSILLNIYKSQMQSQLYHQLINMNSFIESLKGIKLSQHTEQKLKKFDEKIPQVYRILEQPRPYFLRGVIIGNSINFVQGQQEMQKIPQSGIIVGRIYQLINPSRPSTEEKNLEFRGSCFLVTTSIAVCCSHQIMENKCYIIRIDGRLFKDRRHYSIKIKKTMKNIVQKIRPGQTKSEDYAFLVLQEMELTLKKTLDNFLMKTKITTIEGIQNSMFKFDARIYGYFQKLPKQFDSEQEDMKVWKKWTPMDIIQSEGSAEYINQELSYTMSTDFGFSGAPIILVDKKVYYIVGLHTRGSHFHSKNYGILFGQTFFMYLQKVINECSLQQKGKSSLEQMLNIEHLAQKVQYRKNLRQRLQEEPDIEFVGKVIEKIIQKMEEFEDSELVVEQLRLQDIIISKQSKTYFFLDFSRLRLSELVQKGSKDQSNLQRIAQVTHEIKKILSKNPSISKFITPEQYYLENNAKLNKNEAFLLIIQRCIADCFNVSWAFGSKLIKILLNRIRYAKSKYDLEEYLTISSSYPIEYSEDKLTAQQKLSQIIQMTKFKLHQDIFRKKFCNLMKYSKEKLQDSVIARIYLLKLSYFYNHLKKVIQFFIWLTQGQQIPNSDSETENQISYFFQIKLQRLKDLQMFYQTPKFTLLGQNFIFQIQGDKQQNEKIVKDIYQSILNNEKVYFSQEEINNLVKNEYIFIRTYFKCFNDLIRELDAYKDDRQLAFWIFALKPQIWQEKMSQIMYKHPQPLKKATIDTKPLNIHQSKIFQDIFIDYEHSTFNKYSYDIANMSAEQEKKYEDILNILVQIRGIDGKSRGTGFFLDNDIICTASHIFDGQSLQSFQLTNEKLQLSCKILQSLTSFDENTMCSDIIFLKVRVRFYSDVERKQYIQEKPYFSKNIVMLDNDFINQKEFNEKSLFGLLIGLRRKGSNQRQIKPTKSYGQIQLNQGYHQLIGQPHLSGSPIFLRTAQQRKDKEEEVEYSYVIIGIYSGIEGKHSKYSGMQRFNARSFSLEESFLQNLEFPKLSTCIYQITDQLKQCITTIYTSFDHFLLTVMGQMLRLNSLSIYVKKLSINNIIFADNLPNDMAFSRLPIKVHLQSEKMTKQMFEIQKLELESQNKNAFAGFITDLLADKTHAISSKSEFVRQSVLVDQLDMLNSSASLTQYFQCCLQGRYSFAKEDCILKRIYTSHQEIIFYRPQQLLTQSKFDMLYNRMPAQHLARLRMGYSLLKNSVYDIDTVMIDNRGTMLEVQVLRGKKLLQKYSKQKLDDSQYYFLAKKFVRDAIEATLLQLDKRIILNHISQETQFNKFIEQFKDYLFEISNYSNLSLTIRVDFIHENIRKANYYFLQNKRWNLISEVLDLYNSFQV